MKAKIIFAASFAFLLAACASTEEKAYYATLTARLKADAEIAATKAETDLERQKNIGIIAAKADPATLVVLAAGLGTEGALRAANGAGGQAQPAPLPAPPESVLDKGLRITTTLAGIAKDVAVPVTLARYTRDTLIAQSNNQTQADIARTNSYVAINDQTAALGTAIATRPNPPPNVTTTVNNTTTTTNNTLTGKGVVGGGTYAPVTNTTTTTTTTNKNCQGGNTSNGGPGGSPGSSTSTTGTPSTGTGGQGGQTGSANGGTCG